MKLDAVADRCQDILTALGQVVVGKADVLQHILAGILANGHILIEDYPGLAKTLIARLIAQTLDLGFKRIQFTPDLLPSDITGSFLFNQREGRFEFRRGPIFTNLLLADEINRATPKTQSALLEAMQEAQVTDRGRALPARAAIPRDRHAEPDRARGHVRAARGAARPLPDAPAASAIRTPRRKWRSSRAGAAGARTR